MSMRRIGSRATAGLLVSLLTATAAGGGRSGAEIYDYYCYQCHGYSGDARTLASTFLEPPPRDFTAGELPRERMRDALANGRPGTAMVAFSSVLSPGEIEAVVDEVRRRFMSGPPTRARYHTARNGWPAHERYRAAFPFATGALALDTPWESLDADARQGKRLYLDACVSCHDRGRVRDAGPVWELRALSYPRRHYSHVTGVDGLSGASPYALHDRASPRAGLSSRQREGETLFLDNCAFCHAADGTGRNWIGSFLQPRPRDLTAFAARLRVPGHLYRVIRDGLPGTSMPAWKNVLDERQLAALVDFLQAAFLRSRASDPGQAGRAGGPS